MSKTRGFSVDFHIPSGGSYTKHIHKLDDVKDFVSQNKIPSVTIHSVADKWHGSAKELANLNKWPVVPDQLGSDGPCPVCELIKKEKK